LSRLRVLVVDLHHDSRVRLALLLRLWGQEVRVAADGPATSLSAKEREQP
jgi:hypothetical protein